MFHGSVFLEKSLNGLVLVCFIFTCFLITMHEIVAATEVYLALFQTYMIEIFCESKQLLAHHSCYGWKWYFLAKKHYAIYKNIHNSAKTYGIFLK